MAFSHLTRGNSAARGKSRVCFLCCQKDFNHWFPAITEEIFATQNCVIWYCDQGNNANVDFPDLANMQLLVMPVTSGLLSDDFIISECIPFAVENRIPILPIMVESCLDKAFNDKCGDLEYLDKTSLDPTARPYEERLTQFLNSVLLDDTQIEEIKSAFDAYIFLSYRKKDRAYAQELMKLIHQNSFCERVAIWYDEFLVPGESFNQAIESAIQKSSLFSLVVTPNLVNEKNYVSEIEYPTAKANGKTILSFEMEKTEFSDLEKSFSGISRPIDRTETTKISSNLKESLPLAGASKNDAVHNFFVGLAYLSGIDVEVDKERAYRLILSAAEEGLIAAMKKLVSMYSKGEGVLKNIDSAINWQRRLVRKLEQIAEASNTEQDALELLKQNMQLAELACSIEDYGNAADSCEASLKLARILSFSTTEKKAFKKIKTLFKKYVLNKSCFEESIGYYFKAHRLRLEIAFKQGILEDIEKWSAKSPLLLSMTKGVMTEEVAGEIFLIGKIMCQSCIESGNLTAAKFWLDNEEKIYSQISDEELTPRLQYAFSFMYDVAASYYEAQAKYADAYKCLQNRLSSLNKLLAEFPDDAQIRFQIINCIIHETKICIDGGDIEFAQRCIDEGLDRINEESSNDKENPEIEFLKSSLGLLQGNICLKRTEYKQARSILEDVFSSLDPLLERFYDAEHVREQTNACELIGDCFWAEEQYEEAYKWHYRAKDLLESVNVFAKQVKDSRTLARLYEKLLDDSLCINKACRIREWNEKALWIRRGLVNGLELRRVGIRSSKDVAELVEQGKLESPQFIEDQNKLRLLEDRQDSIKTALKKHKDDKKNSLEQYICSSERNKPEIQKELYSAMIIAIDDYLSSHFVPEIRGDVENLQGILIDKEEVLFDENIKEEKVISTIGKNADDIQVYLIEHYRPFVKYDETSVLLLAFCGYIYLYYAQKIIGGREPVFKDYLKFYKDIVFWNYSVEDLKYTETWGRLHQWIQDSCPVEDDFLANRGI